MEVTMFAAHGMDVRHQHGTRLKQRQQRQSLSAAAAMPSAPPQPLRVSLSAHIPDARLACAARCLGMLAADASDVPPKHAVRKGRDTSDAKKAKHSRPTAQHGPSASASAVHAARSAPVINICQPQQRR